MPVMCAANSTCAKNSTCMILFNTPQNYELSTHYSCFIDEEIEIQNSFIAGKWHNQNLSWDLYAKGCGPATTLLCFSFIHSSNSELFIHYSTNTDWLPAICQVLF